MNFVLDCSVCMAWCFEDEAGPATDALFDRARDHGTVVPPVWHLEVANALIVGERRGRVIEGRADAFLETLALLDIVTDPASASATVRDTFRLARRHGLSAYDASYIELALRRGLPLASCDKRLNETAENLGIARLLV